MDLTLVGQGLLSGLLFGGVYSLMAVGLTLIFGVMRVVNFAHGDMMVWGMYLAWLLATRGGLDPYLGFPLCALALFALGWAVQRGLVHRIVDAPHGGHPPAHDLLDGNDRRPVGLGATVQPLFEPLRFRRSSFLVLAEMIGVENDHFSVRDARHRVGAMSLGTAARASSPAQRPDHSRMPPRCVPTRVPQGETFSATAA